MNKTIWALLLLPVLSIACEKKEEAAPEAPAIETTVTTEESAPAPEENASTSSEETPVAEPETSMPPAAEEAAEQNVVQAEQPKESEPLGISTSEPADKVSTDETMEKTASPT